MCVWLGGWVSGKWVRECEIEEVGAWVGEEVGETPPLGGEIHVWVPPDVCVAIGSE